MRSVSSAASTLMDSQATQLSQSVAVERSVNKRLRIGRSPYTTFYIPRTVQIQLGYDQRDGFTNTSGSIIYGNGLAFGFRLSSIIMNGNALQNNSYSVPNSSEFTSLFDSWRIGAVEMKWFFSNNTANWYDNTGGTAPPATGLPVVQSAVDFDDDTAPSSPDVLLQYNTLRLDQFDTNGPKVFRFKPKAVTSTEAGGILATGYSQFTGWCDCDYPGTDWFGIKLWTPTVGTTSNQAGVWTLYTTIFYEFRGVR